VSRLRIGTERPQATLSPLRASAKTGLTLRGLTCVNYPQFFRLPADAVWCGGCLAMRQP
jgi:hypothetical protein